MLFGVSRGNEALRRDVTSHMVVDMLEETLTSAQAAQESGIKKRTVQYQLMRGHLKGRQIPGSRVWLIARADFEAWLAERDRQTHNRKESISG